VAGAIHKAGCAIGPGCQTLLAFCVHCESSGLLLFEWTSPLAIHALELGLSKYPILWEFLFQLIPDLLDRDRILSESVHHLSVDEEQLWIVSTDRKRPLQVFPRFFSPPLFGQRHPHQEIGLRFIGHQLECLPGEIAEKCTV
jgi:hypothetical protein